MNGRLNLAKVGTANFGVTMSMTVFEFIARMYHDWKHTSYLSG